MRVTRFAMSVTEPGDVVRGAANRDADPAVGLRLRVCVREMDLVARLGGDEFGVLVTSLDSAGYAEEVAERILESLRKPLKAADRSFDVFASIGVSKFPDDGIDAATLLRKADAAMYRAKQKGKSTFST